MQTLCGLVLRLFDSGHLIHRHHLFDAPNRSASILYFLNGFLFLLMRRELAVLIGRRKSGGRREVLRISARCIVIDFFQLVFLSREDLMLVKMPQRRHADGTLIDNLILLLDIVQDSLGALGKNGSITVAYVLLPSDSHFDNKMVKRLFLLIKKQM